MRIRLNASLLGASLALTCLTIPVFCAPQDPAVQSPPALALTAGPLMPLMPVDGIEPDPGFDRLDLDGSVGALAGPAGSPAAMPADDVVGDSDVEAQRSIQRAAAKAEAEDFSLM